MIRASQTASALVCELWLARGLGPGMDYWPTSYYQRPQICMLLFFPPNVSVSHVYVCMVYAHVYIHVCMFVGTRMYVSVCVCIWGVAEVAVRGLLLAFSTLYVDLGSLKGS